MSESLYDCDIMQRSAQREGVMRNNRGTRNGTMTQEPSYKGSRRIRSQKNFSRQSPVFEMPTVCLYLSLITRFTTPRHSATSCPHTPLARVSRARPPVFFRGHCPPAPAAPARTKCVTAGEVMGERKNERMDGPRLRTGVSRSRSRSRRRRRRRRSSTCEARASTVATARASSSTRAAACVPASYSGVES